MQNFRVKESFKRQLMNFFYKRIMSHLSKALALAQKDTGEPLQEGHQCSPKSKAVGYVL